MSLAAGGPDFAARLEMQAEGPLVLHGAQGYSVKSAAGQASRYYSQPFLAATGEITTRAGSVPVSGSAWIDREWSSQPLAPDQQGWDWFSLSFDSGDKLMAFRLRGAQDFTAATWIAPDGRTTALPDGAVTADPLDRVEVAGRSLPLRWRLSLPARALEVEVAAIYPEAWMPMLVPYWEGPVTVAGSHPGRGYLEMTGYS